MGRPQKPQYPRHSEDTQAYFLAVRESEETIFPEESDPDRFLKFPACSPPGFNGLYPKDPHLLICIIGALLQRIARIPRKGTRDGKGATDEARRLATMIRLLAVRKARFSLRPGYFQTTAMSVAEWLETYGDLLHAIGFLKVPRHTHLNEILPLQREVLHYFFYSHKYPEREYNRIRNPSERSRTIRKWIIEHEESLLEALHVFPCLCVYADTLNDISEKLLKAHSGLSEIRDLILATLHKATIQDIVKWSKPKSATPFPDLLYSTPVFDAITWPDELTS
jgi:hypothetical protein